MDALIVGLGNPGKQYEWTRHNLGFLVLDQLLKDWTSASTVANGWKLEKRWKTEFAKLVRNGQSIGLLKPQTYMNLSGQAVGSVAQFYQVPPERVCVVVDDVNLPFGRMRYRAGGSAGGHNGLKSIQQVLGTAAYPRLRVGVGEQQHPEQALSDHVLGLFSTSEREQLVQVLSQTVTVLDQWLTHMDVQPLQQFCNGWQL